MLGGISWTSLLNRKARLFFTSGLHSVRARFVHDDEELGLEAVSEMPDEARLSFDSSEMSSGFLPTAATSSVS